MEGERGCSRTNFETFTSGTFYDKSRGKGEEGRGKRLLWIGIGLEFEPRRVFQSGLNGVF